LVHRDVEWSFQKDPDLIVQVWSTSALLEAVIGALLQEPENLRLAVAALSGKPVA